MKAKKLLLTVSAIWMMAGQLEAQQQPVYYQTLNCIKVKPGKGREWTQFERDTSMKVAQMRADAGEILTWSLLRSVMPAGQEARCSHMIATLSEGSPRAPLGPEGFEKALQKAGVNMTASDWTAKAISLASLVSTEMWRPRIRVGAPQKDHYLFLNYMKVHDAPEYNDFENNVWRPMAEAWVKEGSQSAWIFATKVLPSGTETTYTAYSADIYPSWDAAFKQRSTQTTFEKVHSGKNYQQTMTRLGKVRDLARRELWVVVERVAKK
jgi:hypothetical protein